MRHLIFVLALVGCAQTQPLPAPLIDPNVDPFTNRNFDCNGIDTAPLLPVANACADAPANLACAAGEALTTANIHNRQGVADARADALQTWFTFENVTLHNKWCR